MSAEGCDKRCYPSEGKAQRQARLIRSDAGGRWHAYLCPECRAWHISSAGVVGPTHNGHVPKPPPAPGGRRRGRRPSPGESVEELARRMREER
jgi:hypothetical protein